MSIYLVCDNGKELLISEYYLQKIPVMYHSIIQEYSINPKESTIRLKIKYFKEEIVKEMINFASGGQLQLNDEKLAEMITLADKYNYVQLLKECDRKMVETLNNTNMNKFAAISKRYKLDSQTMIEQFVQKSSTENA